MELRDYQLEIAGKAISLLNQYRIAYLAMQVRTGKTLTALHTADLFHAKSVLFVTKLKAIRSIEQDYEELQPTFRLTTINFESIHKLKATYDLVIIDEAHSLGQYPLMSERTTNLKKLCKGLPIIFLSGTPSPESYSQLFHQFHVSSFSPFSEYGSFYKWASEFVIKKEKFIFNRKINDYSNAIKEKVEAKCQHLFLTFTQAEAGFTQFVKEEVLTVPMEDKTYALANRLIKKRVYIGREGQEIVADTEVSLMQKLHQIYSGTIILQSGEQVCFDLSKAKFIRDHFTGQKVAIFYKFRAEFGALVWAFGSDYITDDPQLFNERDDLAFVCQVQSGREGLNLSTADCLIFYNIDFSAVSYWQARARMQTKDRTKEVLLYWIFSKDGIEEKIYKVVQGKKNYTTSYFRKDYAQSDTYNGSHDSIGKVARG